MPQLAALHVNQLQNAGSGPTFQKHMTLNIPGATKPETASSNLQILDRWPNPGSIRVEEDANSNVNQHTFRRGLSITTLNFHFLARSTQSSMATDFNTFNAFYYHDNFNAGNTEKSN